MLGQGPYFDGEHPPPPPAKFIPSRPLVIRVKIPVSTAAAAEKSFFAGATNQSWQSIGLMREEEEEEGEAPSSSFFGDFHV